MLIVFLSFAIDHNCKLSYLLSKFFTADFNWSSWFFFLKKNILFEGIDIEYKTFEEFSEGNSEILKNLFLESVKPMKNNLTFWFFFIFIF